MSEGTEQWRSRHTPHRADTPQDVLRRTMQQRDTLAHALRFLYGEWQRVRGTKFQLVEDALDEGLP